MDMKKVLQLVGLSLLVVVLPAASWYFLKSGLDYRLESMDKLGDYGQLPVVDLKLSNGKDVNTATLENKMVIVHEMSIGTTRIMQFYRQFSKRLDLQFILTDAPQLKLKADRVANLWLLDNQSSVNKSFLDESGLGKTDGRNVALIDISGDIRNYYDLDQLSELQQLVEHTAFLLPVEETEKPVIQRESEK